MSSNAGAFPTPSSKVSNGELKRLKQINDILQTLGLPNNVEKNNGGKYEKFRQSIDPQIVKRILLSPTEENSNKKKESDDEEKEMIFVWKMDKRKFISLFLRLLCVQSTVFSTFPEVLLQVGAQKLDSSKINSHLIILKVKPSQYSLNLYNLILLCLNTCYYSKIKIFLDSM